MDWEERLVPVVDFVFEGVTVGVVADVLVAVILTVYVSLSVWVADFVCREWVTVVLCDGVPES